MPWFVVVGLAGDVVVAQVGRDARLDVELGAVVGVEEPGGTRLGIDALAGQVRERITIPVLRRPKTMVRG